MSILWSILWASAVTVVIKPLYLLNMMSIALLMNKQFPASLWKYTSAEWLSGSALWAFMFLDFRYGGVLIGLASGCVGVTYLSVIHCRCLKLLRACKENDS